MNEIINLVLIVALIGLFVLGLLVFFAYKSFTSKQAEFFNYSQYLEFMNNNNVRPNMPKYLNEAFADYLAKRNEFWNTFTQVMIAAFIIIVLTVLMLTKVISSEPGLPILSAVSGFAIAKSVRSEKSESSSRNEYE